MIIDQLENLKKYFQEFGEIYIDFYFGWWLTMNEPTLRMYVDENGNSVKTENMTEAQHKAMAEYYKFIVKKYFEIIPAAQQYGITQWCITDAPSDSGWRGGEPVGLWDSNYSRKHTYAGFADGLAGK